MGLYRDFPVKTLRDASISRILRLKFPQNGEENGLISQKSGRILGFRCQLLEGSSKLDPINGKVWGGGRRKQIKPHTLLFCS